MAASAGGGIKNRRNLASHYVPNFWLFIDAPTGGFKSPRGVLRNGWRDTAETLRARIKNDEKNRYISLDWDAP